MRAAIDQEKCQGHARCAILAPEVFDVDDFGKGFVLLAEVPAGAEADVREAGFSCPESAITVTE